jgi:pimeloyl-ACP methyl ester carboxylesterase
VSLFSDEWLADARARVNADPELQTIGRWFTVAFSVTCGERRVVLGFERGRLVDIIASPRLDVRCAFGFRAAPEIWAKFFADTPEPLYHDFFAMLMRVPGFVLEGDTLVAMQHARALHRAMNVIRGHIPSASSASSASSTSIEPILGRYINLSINGADHRIYFEEAGEGIPLLCLHTAGADSRQYRHMLNDPAITTRYRIVAFDVPHHGRSNPADLWWRQRYHLTTADYLAMIRAVWTALDLVRPVVIGCSMGGAIVLKLAAEYQRELRGIIGLESSAFAPGRFNEFLHPPAVHGGELVASYTYGLCAPASPEANARENWWYYSQSGPGVYAGDVHFYSDDWDGREDITRIDTAVCKVSLLTGEYDYSCTPDMTRKVAEAIKGSRIVIMKSMGHFPMIENYPLFRGFLLPELDFMAMS